MTHSEYAAQTFGFEQAKATPLEPVKLPMPEPGEITCVIGHSGAGKSVSLQAMMHPGAHVLVPLRSEELQRPVLELFDGVADSERVLRTLARAGLADGRMWGMRASELSAGECRRLELALAICHAKPKSLLIADEFDAHLDTTTARVIAENLRRVAQRDRLRVVVSTHRLETLPQLAATYLIELENGQARRLTRPQPGTLIDEVVLRPGRVRDYDTFAHWHYLGHGRPGPTSDVFIASHAGRDIGIALFGYPHLLLSARGKVLSQFAPAKIRSGGAKGLNRDVRLLQRVVVDPRFRGIGVARKLIMHGLAQVETPYIECVAQMGAFSDFLLGAGFRRVCDIDPPAAAARIMAFAKQQGFSAQALFDARSRRLLIDYLPGDAGQKLQRLLDQLVKSRIETGHGSLRGKPQVGREAMLRKALSRLCARPGYFLWSRDES